MTIICPICGKAMKFKSLTEGNIVTVDFRCYKCKCTTSIEVEFENLENIINPKDAKRYLSSTADMYRSISNYMFEAS